MKNLYLVTCASTAAGGEKTMDVYVIAENESGASEKAIQAMRDASYSFDDYVKRVELIASPEKYQAPLMLIGV